MNPNAKAVIGHWHADLDVILAARIGTINEDVRKSLLPLINCMVELTISARTDSILTLERQRMQLSDPDLSTGLRMLIDGTEPDEVISWFRNRIVFSEIHGLELLRLIVITTGLEAIASGRDPQFVQNFLVSYLGEDIFNEFEQSKYS